MAATISHRDLRDEYIDFLQQERFQLVDRINTSLADYAHHQRGLGGGTGWGCPRVRIDLAELRSYNDGQLSQQLRVDPLRHLRALEAACHNIASDEQPGYDKEGRIKVALSGPVGAKPSSPRNLKSSLLRQLVCVEGVATKVSAIKPKLVKSVHYNSANPDARHHMERAYVDATDPELGLPRLDADGMETDRMITVTPSVYPTKDSEGYPLETEFGLSTFKDHQTITLQEMPERAPMGQLPRSVELILDHDLVDRVKPGDRIMVVGVYRALATGSSGQSSTSGVFRTAILANNVQILGRDTSHLTFSPQDIRTIKALGQRDDILEVLGRSISPSIHGHSVIKKSLALQLLSGCEKNLENGTHLRGDINILMVGDPSTAKSQLLRSAMMIAPLAVSTTGKGSSGVGLTAAVTSDPETRERRLEAGAMVLGDRGLVCVDEFDKMGENDRVAIHEAMEQQTVTIAKAGIHASLNARCSILAAANPVFGQYDRTRRIQENIGLPDSLLSRFDLLFVVLDQMDPETDRRIATHVIRGHRYRPEYGQAVQHDDDYSDDDDSDDEFLNDDAQPKPPSIWQSNRHTESPQEILQHDFLRKYLHFAKTRMQPELTEEAREFIANSYAELRCRQDERTLPVTARTLETIIRLASAHAKARLSTKVESEPDCKIAMDVLSFTLHHEHTAATTNTNPTPMETDENVTLVSDDDDGGGVTKESGQKRTREQSTADDPTNSKKLQVKKSQLWETIVSNEGEMPVGELCSSQEDQLAINYLIEEGKLVLGDDGIVYQC